MDTISSARLDFLWKASHEYACTIPQLSSYLLQSFQKYSLDREVEISATAKRTFCQRCGTIFLPAVTSKTRIHKDKSTKKQRKLIKTKRKSDNLGPSNDVRAVRRDTDHKSPLPLRNLTKSRVIVLHSDHSSSKAINQVKKLEEKQQSYMSVSCLRCRTISRYPGFKEKQSKISASSKNNTHLKAIPSSKQSAAFTSQLPAKSSSQAVSKTVTSHPLQPEKNAKSDSILSSPSSRQSSVTADASKAARKKQKKKSTLQGLLKAQKESSGRTDGLKLSDFLADL
ncbi:hypothetical protein BKA69DRAFT_1078465 [Paraphysoderma sedebokerense]|nr:hypothetical protein BKA69DRAFT_1078465 [Paraphysoderma sedebokerense]